MVARRRQIARQFQYLKRLFVQQSDSSARFGGMWFCPGDKKTSPRVGSWSYGYNGRGSLGNFTAIGGAYLGPGLLRAVLESEVKMPNLRL